MKHLVNDVYIDADKYQFILKKKDVAKTGKNKGGVIYRNIAFPSSAESVFKHIETMSAMEYVNSDWKNMVTMFEEARSNFIRNLDYLIEKRRG
jgi:hypothetical protein